MRQSETRGEKQRLHKDKMMKRFENMDERGKFEKLLDESVSMLRE